MTDHAVDPVLAVGVLPVAGARRVVSCHRSGLIFQRELTTGRPVAELPMPGLANAWCAVVRELAGRPVVVVGRPGEVHCVFLDATDRVRLPVADVPTVVATALVAGEQVVVAGTREGVLWIWHRTGDDFAAPIYVPLFVGAIASVDVVAVRGGAVVVASGITRQAWTVAAVDAHTGSLLWLEAPVFDLERPREGEWDAVLQWEDPRAGSAPTARPDKKLTVRAWYDENDPAVVVCEQTSNTVFHVGIRRLAGWRFGKPPAWAASPGPAGSLRFEGFVASATGPLALWTRDSTVAVTDFPLRIRDTRRTRTARLVKRLYLASWLPLWGLFAIVALSLGMSITLAVVMAVGLALHPLAGFVVRPDRHPTGIERRRRRGTSVELDAEITAATFAAATIVAATPQGLVAVEVRDRAVAEEPP